MQQFNINNQIPIAVIGLGCRFPNGITSLGELWNVLFNGEDVVTGIPNYRFDTDCFLHPDRTAPAKSCTFSAGIVGDLRQFDASFFGFSPKEAASLDPQQRMMLEMTWEALEDAGIPPSEFAGTKTAVYVGAASTDMALINSDDLGKTGAYSMTGTSLSIISNRISYYFDLHGPSMTVDTACSSSLVALHEACKAIQNGDADAAIVGGINVLLSPMPFIGFSKAQMLSKEGRCRVFDEHGDGYVRSEGGAAIIIKPLAQAVKDGDNIYAIIRATGVNSDGKTNGIAHPNGKAQETLLRTVYSKPGIDRNRLAYLEAHGTGTAVGDPIEVGSIARALGTQNQPLLIGSVKGNLGHLETGSGMAGLAKALLVMQKGIIPPNIQCSTLNPKIPFMKYGITVPMEPTPLPKVEGEPLIGVNSFGFGGTNAHVVLEHFSETPREYPKIVSKEPLIISAKSKAALQKLAGSYAKFLSSVNDEDLDFVPRAVREQRDLLKDRFALGLNSKEDGICLLTAFANNETFNPEQAVYIQQTKELKKIAFVFSGNGCQWVGMGRELLNNSTFLGTIKKIDNHFKVLADWSILEKLQAPNDSWDLGPTEIAQPLLFAVQVGLVEVLRENSIYCDGVIGHSVGEVAAAWCAGLLDLESAVRVIYERSMLQGKTAGTGVMAAVRIPENSLQIILEKLPSLEIAGKNSHRDFTISGSQEDLVSLKEMVLREKGLFTQLPLNYAFHSSKMEQIREKIFLSLEGLSVNKANKDFFSTVRGRRIDESLEVSYWWHNIRDTVLFKEALQSMLEDGYSGFIEIGTHPILTGYIRNIAKEQNKEVEIQGLMRKQSSLKELKSEILKLSALGFAHYTTNGRIPRLRDLPRYQWDKTLCWVKDTSDSYGLFEPRGSHPLLGREQRQNPRTWDSEIDLQNRPWLSGHKIQEEILFPAAAFLEMVIAAGKRKYPERSFEILNLSLLRSLALDKKPLKHLRTRLAESGVITVSSRDAATGQDWTEHLQGRIVVSSSENSLIHLSFSKDARRIELGDFYEKIQTLGYKYDRIFKVLSDVWRDEDRFVAKLVCPDEEQQKTLNFPIGPLDGVFHALLFIAKDHLSPGALFLPAWFGRTVIWKTGRPVWVTVNVKRCNERILTADFVLFNEQKEALMKLEDCRFRRVPVRHSTVRPGFYQEKWDLSPNSLKEARVPSLIDSLGELQNAFSKLDNANLLNGETKELLELLAVSYIYEGVRNKGEPSLAGNLFTDAFQAEKEEYAEYLANVLVSFGLAEKEDSGLFTVHGSSNLPPSDLLWQSILADCSTSWHDLIQATLVGKNLSGLVEGSVKLDQLKEQAGLKHCLRESQKLFSSAIWRFLEQSVQNSNIALTICIDDSLLFPESFCHLNSTKIDIQIVTFSEESYKKLKPLVCEHLGLPLVFITEESKPSTIRKADCVVALHSIAFAKDVTERILLLRSLLLPKGALLLTESVDDGFINFLEGAKDSWWHLQDGVVSSPFFSRGALQEQLRINGFKESSVIFDEILSPNVLYLAKADERGETCNTERIDQITVLLPEIEKDSGNAASKNLQIIINRFKESGTDVVMAKLSTLPPVNQRIVNFLNYQTHQDDGIPLETLSLMQLLEKGQVQAKQVVHIGAFDSISGKALQGLNRSFVNEHRDVLSEYIGLKDFSEEVINFLIEECTKEIRTADEVLISREGLLLDAVIEVDQKKEKSKSPFLLSFDAPGRLDRLYWKESKRHKITSCQIRVEVKATALNFRDVMWTMGMLPEEALENGFAGCTLGLECSGVVTEIGEEVKKVKVGDSVIAFGSQCFASEIITEENAVALKPDNMSFEEASGIPVAFFTAWYSIAFLARARKGEKILIHGGAGGVGLAAIQVAKTLGLEVFASAGNEAKRSFLKSLGIQHIYDSRTLSFQEQIENDTKGEGVDIVLNSLSGVAAEKSLSLLKPFGRFLEIGKRDFFADSPMYLRVFRKNISYFGIDVDQLLVESPKLAGQLFTAIMMHFEKGEFLPLPTQIFSGGEVISAFKTMQASSHVGKIAISIDTENLTVVPKKKESSLVVRDGAYVITGGLGGLGFSMAQKLVERGARKIVLISRSGQPKQYQINIIEEWKHKGVCVYTPAMDVGAPEFKENLKSLLEEIGNVYGVMHTAGVTEDAILRNQTPEKFQKVWTPKVKGLEALDKVFSGKKGKALDWFVIFSSATVLIGNPGQGNYVAANMACEAIANDRYKNGLPATIIRLGAVEDVGMFKGNEKAKAILINTFGTGTILSKNVWEAIGDCVTNGYLVTDFIPIDWTKMRNVPAYSSNRFRHYALMGPGNSQTSVSLKNDLKTLPEDQSIKLLVRCLIDEISAVVGIPSEDIKPEKPIAEFGMDSLLVVELGVALEEKIGEKIPGSIFVGARDVEALAHRIFQLIRGTKEDEEISIEAMSIQQGVNLNSATKKTALNAIK